MGKAATDFGLQMAQNAGNGIMGMIMGGYNDSRQRNQQQHLQDMQIAGQKEMAQYNYRQQMKMWEETNYSAQMAQLKKAGLNPGLIYGMGGGGGTTTGSGGGAGPSGAQAPSGGGEMQAMMGMGIQSQLLQAQKENIEAQTEKTKAETANVPLTGEQTKASTGLTQVNTAIAKIEQEVKGRSIEAAIRTIDAAGEKMIQEAEAGRYKNQISEGSWQTQVTQIKTDLITSLLNNEQIKAQTNLTEQQTQAIATKIVQDWNELNIKQQNATTQQRQQNLNEWIHNVQESTKLTADVIQGIIGGVLRKGTKITNNKQTNTEINY